ncbi:MAG: adenylyltransferase/cytidyltransferase family protein [Nanoarchaeota archaeon]
MNSKLKLIDEIKKKMHELRRNNPNIKIVTTNGAFDLLHVGHLKSLEEAKKCGDVLIVGLNSDSSIKQYKSKDRPIISQNDRAKMLSALECVDYVVIFDEPNPCKMLEAIKPDFHVKSKSGFLGIEKDVVEKGGGRVVLIRPVKGVSTTNISKRIFEICSKEIRIK